MSKPEWKSLPQAVRDVVGIRHTYDHQEQGWVACNSVIPDDCRPIYQATGGGTGLSDLVSLDKALDASIENVKDRILKAQRHLKKLEAARAALP